MPLSRGTVAALTARGQAAGACSLEQARKQIVTSGVAGSGEAAGQRFGLRRQVPGSVLG